jgi:type IX secretion system PorP/SprF family membrane protein
MRRRLYFPILSAFCFLLTTPGFSQDRLYTQAFVHPVDLNAAYAGAINGRYRVSAAYRDQWRSIVESPFTTIGVYGDVKIKLEHQDKDFFGAGFAVTADRTAVLNVDENNLTLYGSYHKSLNADQHEFLSGGLSLGITQRNINYENIYFNDQFNGLDEYSLSTAEDLPANNFAFADLGLGVAYSTFLSRYSNMTFGLSLDHVPGSSISFYTHSLQLDEPLPDARIYRKLTAMLSMELASNEYISVLPRILWQQEGPHKMLSAATLVKFDISNYSDAALHVGAGIRMNQTQSQGFKTAAVYLMTAYEINGLLIGLSHDITTSGLGSANPGSGAFELSISYTGFYENDEHMCPTF